MKNLLILLILMVTQSSIFSQETLSTMGQFHNDGLAYAKTRLNSNSQVTDAAQVVNSFVGSEVLSGKSLSKLQEFYNTPDNGNNLVLSETQKLLNRRSISQLDYEFINKFRQIFNANYGSMNDGQISIEIKKRLEMLKTENVNFEITEAIGIAIASNEYWNENPGTDGGEIHAWVQGDAFGYLVGWASAVIDELDENGALDEENSGKRIRKGAEFAVGVSAGGWF